MPGKISRAALAAGSIALGGCSVEQGYEESTAAADQELIGGRPATDAEFPSTLYAGQCTAAKVGPRHILLAAHCVHNSDTNMLYAEYAPGQQVEITQDNNFDTAVFVRVTVSQTHVHPQWFADCTAPCGANIVNGTQPPDVALIVIQEDTPTIPESRVDLSTVGVNDPLVIMGYGCENAIGQPSPPPAKLKLEFVPALSQSDMMHTGSLIDQSNVTYFTGSYLATPGRQMTPTGASLCPGDSGGPAYRNDGQQRNIVGINAYYTFPPNDMAGISRTNLHTRLDGASRYTIGSWLQGLGANVVTTKTPLINASFNTSGNTNGFTYLDDAFGTTQPAYASGAQVTSFNGTLGARVSLGGIDNVTVNGMSGGWRAPFTVAAASSGTLTFRYNLSQSDGYESNEASEVRVRVDQTGFGMGGNAYVARVSGNGTGGPAITTGWQVATIHVPSLTAGAHELVVGGFNNAKTASDESTTLLLDDVALTLNSVAPVERTEGGAATATGTACGSGTETPPKAFDNLMTSANFTKWCVQSTPTTSAPVSIVYDFSGTTAYAVTSYTVTTGNDNATRDPKDWTFQGCQGTCNAGSDTGGWVTLNTQVNQFPAGTARLFTKTFAFSNTTAYQQYRLRMTANNGAVSRTQITEIQMF